MTMKHRPEANDNWQFHKQVIHDDGTSTIEPQTDPIELALCREHEAE